MNICSKCGHDNRAGALLCEECGHMLEELVKAKETKGTIKFDTPAIINAQLLAPDKLVVSVPRSQNQELIVVDIDQGEFIIGRGDDGNVVEIDLIPYGAARLGVSRRHARIFYSTDSWMVEDLGSTNGSYLNRRKMSPNAPNIIRHGDELVLGKMLLQVFFSFDDSTTGLT